MFNISNLKFSYDNVNIFDNASMSVHDRDIVGIVGDNGSGKTTLLNVIAGTITPDSGVIDVDRSCIGYIHQQLDQSMNVKDLFCVDVEQWQIDYALDRVDLDHNISNKKVSQLSGGEQTRLSIAVVLSQEIEPELLLMDEPTNNIDKDARCWLEQYISSFNGIVVIASHDREFLDNVTNKIIEIQDCKITSYLGNYDSYKKQKRLELKQVQNQYEQYLSEKKRLKGLRNKKQEQSKKTTHESYNKLKHEDRSVFAGKRNTSERSFGKQISALDSRLEQLDKVERPKVIKERSFALDGENARSKILIKLENICKSYSIPVINDFNLEIRGLDRIHLQGRNGTGKTTLLKIIAQIIEPDKGSITLGPKVEVGYFSQDVLGLQHNKSAFENLSSSCTDKNLIYRSCASFGFIESDLIKKISELSRGQQAKIGFTKLLLDEKNLLVLDEPTNHLDIRTREQIEEALQSYNGAIIVASHDQYFVDEISCNLVVPL